jgi:hypothetical protein
MTTTRDTATRQCEGVRCLQDATEDVTAVHLEVERDHTAWSRPVSTRLCDDCVADWECDEETVIIERHLL